MPITGGGHYLLERAAPSENYQRHRLLLIHYFGGTSLITIIEVRILTSAFLRFPIELFGQFIDPGLCYGGEP